MARYTPRYLQSIFGFEPKTKSDFLKILGGKIGDYKIDKSLELILESVDLAEEDTIELIQVYIERGNDQSGNNKNEKKVLRTAFEGKMRNAIDLLMRRFSYLIDKIDDEGNSITHQFVEKENKKFIGKQMYFEPSTYVDDLMPEFVRDPFFNTEAWESETASFVECLIEKGFDFHRQNHEGKSALFLCVQYNLQHIAVEILKHSREMNLHNSLLCLFLEKNAEHRIKSRSYERKKEWYETYISRYATDIVKILLDQRIPELALDVLDRSPLHNAVKGAGNTRIGELVIDHLIQTNNDITKVLVELLKSCEWWDKSKTEYYLNVLRNLISNGANVNVKDENGRTPIYWAFYGKNRDAVNFLHDHGANFGVVTEIDENLFHALAKKTESMKTSNETDDDAQEKLVEFLASKGCCDVNAKTNLDGETALHLASENGNFAVARKLIEHGADVDCQNANQETPLHLAVHNQAVKVAEILLESGADVNSKDENGFWPLHHAAKSQKKPSVVPVLLKWGAHVNVKVRGVSPFLETIRYGNGPDLAEMLAYGGDINDDSVISAVKSSGTAYQMQIYLMRHCFKLADANLPVATESGKLSVRYNNAERRGVRLAEIEAMKKTPIDDHVSIYNFIHMDFGRRRAYLNEEKLKNLVSSPKLIEKEFPEYAVVIRASYHETVMWKSLVEPAKRGWLKLTGIRLPGECLEFILAHVRNEDLLGMAEYDKNN